MRSSLVFLRRSAMLSTVALGLVLAGATLSATPVEAVNTYAVIATVPVGSSPLGVAVAPDGSKVYVANYSSNSVSVVDAQTFVATSITGAGNGPGYVEIRPQNDRLFVSSYSNNYVSVVNPQTATPSSPITGMNGPWAMALDGTGTFLYVLDYLSPWTVRKIDAATGNVVNTAALGSYANSASVSTDGSRLYASLTGISDFVIMNTYTMSVEAAINPGGQPRSAVQSPSSGDIFVAVTPSSPGPAYVARINSNSLTMDDSWAVGPTGMIATGIASSPDGAQLYVALASQVSGASGSLLIVDSATGQVEDSLTLAEEPLDVVVSPNGDRIYVSNGIGGALSIVEVTTPTPPPPPTPAPVIPASAPRSVQADAGDASASVAWEAPESTGSFPVSTYQATASPGGQTCLVSAPARNCDVTGLRNGTAYTFTVKALTGVGWSASSEPSNAVTPQAPVTPSLLISGSREGKRIIIDGSTTGFGTGGELKPWMRAAGDASFVEGAATILVSANGTFAWSRRSGKRISVYVAALDGAVRSNTVVVR